MRFLRFGAFCLDREQRTLSCDSAPVAIEPKVFACIDLLAARAGELISHAELHAALWPDVRVGPEALRRLIRQARKALGDGRDDGSIIQTRPKLGYVLAATITRDDGQPPARAMHDGWPLVARARERASLRAALLEAEASGRGALCWIAGEAGMGKSSLLSLLRAQHGGRALWLSGYCPSGPGVPAFWAWRSIVAAALRDARRRELRAALGPRDAAWLGLGPDGVAMAFDAQPGAAALFAACARVVTFLCELSAELPLVVTLEDAHFGDDGSLLLLELLAREAERRPLVVLCSYRPEGVAAGSALSRLLGRSSGRLGTRDVSLTALDVAALRELLLALPRPAPISAEALAELSGGNPLFARHLIELSMHERVRLEGHALSLQQVVWERLRFLSASARELLGAAAVLGAQPSLADVAALLSRTTEELQAALDQTLASGVLARAADASLRFQHALLRDALYASLPLARRRELHVSALRVWEHAPSSPEQSSALATHAYLAGPDLPRERTRAMCERAGRDALRQLAFDVAALQLGRALELVPDTDSSSEQAELALAWARACFHADRPSEQIARAYFVAAERAQRAGDLHMLASAAIGCALGDASHTLRIAAAWKRREIALLEAALQALLNRSDPALATERYQVAASLSAMWLSAGDASHARTAALIALEHAPEAPEATDVELAADLSALHLEHAIVTFDPARARARLAELAAHAVNLELEPRARIELGLRVLGGALIAADLATYRRAREHVERATHELTELSQPSRWGERAAAYAGIADSTAFAERLIAGELASAERLLGEIVPRAIAQALARTRHVEWTALLTMLPLFSYLGRAAQLSTAFDAHLAQYPEARWEVAIVRAQIALERGELRVAQRNYGELRETDFRLPHEGQLYAAPPPLLVLLADLCCALGEPDDARALYAALRDWEPLHAAIGVTISWGSYARPLGELASMLGELPSALAHLELALRENERFGHRPEQVRARLALARTLRRAGQATEAAAHAERAALDARAMGMYLPRARWAAGGRESRRVERA